jgi:transketolase N-terminal domain/subunit
LGDSYGKNIRHLEQKAKKHRRQIINFAMKTGHSHIGGLFSAVEILISLYDELRLQE